MLIATLYLVGSSLIGYKLGWQVGLGVFLCFYAQSFGLLNSFRTVIKAIMQSR